MISDARLKELVAFAEKHANPATIISMAQSLLEAREAIRRNVLEVPYQEPTGNGIGTKCYACNVVSLGEPSPKAHKSTCWGQQALKGTS